MSTIYIATKDVVLGVLNTGHDHLYLVYDPDNNPANNDEFIVRGGPEESFPENLQSNPWTMGDIVVEIGEPIEDSEDDLGEACVST